MPSPFPNDDLSLQQPLRNFRAKTRHLKIHSLEVVLLWVVAAHLIFLPWAIGGMRLWGQLISLGFALASFVLALIPRNYTEEHTGMNSFRLVMWPKLARFPIFWIGLLLLGYIVLQGANPSWAYRTDGKGWWMEAIPHNSGWPTSVIVPFGIGGGPWRTLNIYAAAWLTMCSIWIGFTRRQSLHALFITIAVNGMVLATFGLIQRMLSNGKMFWVWVPPAPTFYSSFVYKNHAGSYLDLALSVTCGLAAWYNLRGLRRLEKSNPAGLFVFFATCIGAAILVSYARGPTVVMLVFLCLCAAVFVIHELMAPCVARRPVVAIALTLILGLFLKTGLDALNSQEAWTSFNQGLSSRDSALASRQVATNAAIEMWGDFWQLGAGAGTFRFLFPAYQQRYPEIFTFNGRPGGTRMYWEHAHNDLVETGVELGIPGLVLFSAASIYLCALLIWNRFWENPLSGCLISGNALLLIYSWWDFSFQCPAILILWCALLVMTMTWTNLEEMNIRE